VAAPPAEVQKLRNEVRRLELLVKKLQGELEAQRQYCTALEAHVKSVQDSE
jgi:predicted RNase H-like nuclease (RuvC/YqgF family)